MKILFASVMAVFLGLGSASQVLAEEVACPGGKGGDWKGAMQGGKGPMFEEILKKFDKDGDGKLSDAEKAEAKAALDARKSEWEKKVIAEFDKDGDGKLSDEEKAAAKAAHQANMEERKKMVMQKFDKDGDGKLGEAEKVEAMKFMQEHKGEFKGGDKPAAGATTVK